MDLGDLILSNGGGMSPQQALLERRNRIIASILKGESSPAHSYASEDDTVGAGGGSGGPPVPGLKLPSQAPASGATGTEGLPKEVLTHRVGVGDKGMMYALADPTLDSGVKQALFGTYMQQGQPTQMAGPLGGNYVISPDGKSVVYNPALVKSPVKSGDTEVERLMSTTPQGTMRPIPIEGGAPPAAAPKSGAEPPIGIAPKTSLSSDPLDTVGIGSGEEDDTVGQGGGGVGTALSSGLDPHTLGLIDQLGNISLTKEHKKKLIDKDVETLNKNSALYQELGNKADMTSPEIEYAKKLIEDKNFYSGPLLPLKELAAKFKYLMGDEQAMSANQAFEKVISSGIIDDLKLRLAGTGQVRVAEIDLLRKAAANASNTPGANRVLLELALRAHKMSSDIGKISNGYMEGWRWDKKGNPYMSNELPTNAGLQKSISTYVNNNPLIPKGELENYTKFFEKNTVKPETTPQPRGIKGNKGGANATPAAPPSTPTWQGGVGSPPPNWTLE